MTTEEIEKAIERFTEERRHKSTGYPPKEWFKAGAEFADKHWQEKTRWKSLEKEPPTNYTYDKMYLLRTESGRPYLLPLPYEESVEDFISCGFIEWKEIE